ncbi:MAG: hypothetical protein HY763_14190 [Planctomycetes bacterium]|nr:hypothetical protein [Planctomycetota bacterium]
MTVTITATPGEPQVLRPVHVRVEVVSPKGVLVDVGDYGRALREGVARYDARMPPADAAPTRVTERDKVRLTYDYRIEFVLPDTYELPAVTATYTDARDAAEAAGGGAGDVSPGPMSPSRKEVKSEPLSLVVRAVPGQELTEAELKSLPPLEPVELARRWSRWWWLGPLLALGAGLAAYVMVLVVGAVYPPLRRFLPWLLARLFPRHVPQPAPLLPAHEWARRELARLIGEDLLSRGQFREFYYRISDVVRGYVERRFAVSAPEMTTEEFLMVASRDRRLGAANAEELGRFLSVCDPVKYARYRPEVAEAERLVQVAGQFVERTREREPVEADHAAEPAGVGA